MSEIRFPLPDVGEGLTEAEIVQWRVAPGDRIVLDQVFVEIETAKSLVELPSAFEGVVSELLVDEGNTVDVGTPILVIQTDAATAADDATPAPSSEASVARAAAAAAGGATVASHASAPSEGGGAVLVGHGTSGPSATRRKRHPSPGGAHENLATVPAPARPWPRPRLGSPCPRPPPTARPRPPRPRRHLAPTPGCP